MAVGWNTIAAFVLNRKLGYQTLEAIRQNAIALASSRPLPLGGSRRHALPRSITAQNADEWLDIELDGDELAGFTVQARVECRVTSATISVTPHIQDVTTLPGSTIATGVACSGIAADYTGTDQKQTIVIPLIAGKAKYRLQATSSANTFDAFVIGYIEIFAP